MKSILLISAVFPPEPVVSAKLSYDLACALSKNHNVVVITPKPSRPLGFLFENINVDYSFKHIQVNSYIYPKSNLLGRIRESYSFGRHCSKYIVDNYKTIKIIYANSWPLLSQYFIVKAAKKYDISIIIHVQDVYPESITNKVPIGGSIISFILLPIDKFVLRNANKIIAISTKMKKYLVDSRKIDSDKVTIIQNWQDEEEFQAYDNRLDHTNSLPFTFMYLGNIGPVAGVELLINSFIEAKISDSRLIIAGSGSMKNLLENKVKEQGNTNIEFWSVSIGKVAEIQSFADVLLLPIKKGASSSSIPSKLPAYMFSKKPIIACVEEDSDTANAILKANCGWILPAEDIHLLAEAMKKIVFHDIDDMKMKGENGFDYAVKYLSKKNNLQKLVDVISLNQKYDY